MCPLPSPVTGVVTALLSSAHSLITRAFRKTGSSLQEARPLPLRPRAGAGAGPA